MPESQRVDLWRFLSPYLKARSLSLRKVAVSVGVDPATLSRVMAGRTRPRPELLKSIAECVGADYRALLVAAGYLDRQDSPVERIVTELQSAGNQAEGALIDPEVIKTELKKYEAYSATSEGQDLVRKGFLPKISGLGAVGIWADRLKLMYRYFVDTNAPAGPKILLGAALLYFIVSTDVVPDFLFPVGHLDDAFVVMLIWDQLKSVLTNYGKEVPACSTSESPN
ncbi:MAG: DUF1232 domain-containing protein [Betaproteobacteria bacterium]